MAGQRRGRLDAELVRRHLVETRSGAARLIAEGRVVVDGAPASKPAALVSPAQQVAVRGGQPAWASRGGGKLAGALTALDLPVEGRWCLDAGASTGGFTDVLLRRGARRVVAVDVGYGQLDWRLRQDERVVILDRTNVRHLEAAAVPPPLSNLLVADLSFISLRLVLPAMRSLAVADADFVLLVKPQFEAGHGEVGRGGVVRDPAVWRAAMAGVVEAAGHLGLGLAGAVVSTVPGPAGNLEFFVWLRAGATTTTGPELIEGAVTAAQALRDVHRPPAQPRGAAVPEG